MSDCWKQLSKICKLSFGIFVFHVRIKSTTVDTCECLVRPTQCPSCEDKEKISISECCHSISSKAPSLGQSVPEEWINWMAHQYILAPGSLEVFLHLQPLPYQQRVGASWKEILCQKKYLQIAKQDISAAGSQIKQYLPKNQSYTNDDGTNSV